MRGRPRRITSLVWYALKHYPETRNSDRKLILEIYRMYRVADRPFSEVIEMQGLPSFETIRRVRQKIQEEYPEMRAVQKVEAERIAKQEEWIEFAREGVGRC